MIKIALSILIKYYMYFIDGLKHTKISEPIFKASDPPSEYDITNISNTHLKWNAEHYKKDFDAYGNPSIGMYILKLIVKIAETPHLQRKKFIDYQVKIHEDPIQWLMEVDALMNANAYQFDTDSEIASYNEFVDIISQKVDELENPKVLGESDFNQPKTKIKTKLNIYELSYLFKVLDECDFFEMNIKTDLFRAISETFETKRQTKEDLNIESIASKFYSKDPKAIESLHLKFRKMQEIAFEDKKNIGV
ncbi:MAG: hypothetical protein WCI92_08250 [Bacteroidota bacterium]